ncbi:MAG: dTDP-4-dehydrorhamnose reductase [Candidatus Krumholzibacteriia bacterium]
MTIVIFGGDGQLGSDLRQALSAGDVVPVGHEDADIVDANAVAGAVAGARPQWVINSAAMTHVDRCEEEDVRAFEINALGARNVAVAARSHGARIVHISTDYVFDGSKGEPYVEEDLPRPISAYGLSKLAGEMFVRTLHPEHYIIRTSGLYGLHRCRGKGTNFVDTMLRLSRERDVLRVVSDEVLTPTFSHDLAQQIRVMIEENPPYGIYHATNLGQCSWHEFAAEIFRLAGSGARLEETTAAEWKAPARRPACSVLKNAALEGAGIQSMPDWKDALRRYLEARPAA